MNEVFWGEEAETTELSKTGDALNQRKCPNIIVELQPAHAERHIDPNAGPAEQMQYSIRSTAEPAHYRFFDASECAGKIKVTFKDRGLSQRASSRANGYDLGCKKSALQ